MQISLQNECDKLKLFQSSMVKTSTEADLKKSLVDTKSSVTSSLCSSQNFSSDDEISSSDEAIKTKKNSKIARTSSNPAGCISVVAKENENLSIKKREILRYEKDKIVNHGFDFNARNENYQKNDSINIRRVDMFIKFFFAL